MTKSYFIYVLFTVVMMGGAVALPTPAAAGDFNTIVYALQDSLYDVPTLLSIVCYLGGISFVVFGLFRLKMHVENANNMPLKNVIGMIFIGGALLAAPAVVDAAMTTINYGDNRNLDGLYQDLEAGLGGY